MKTLSIAVWGVGPHARRNVIPAILAVPRLVLRGVCTRDLRTRSELGTEVDCELWDSPQCMLADSDIDAVFLATPTGLHARHGREILAAGKHLWCEKPIVTTLCEANELIALSRDRKVSLAEGFMYLYHPHFSALCALLNSGEVGTIHAVSCRFGIPPLERPGFRLTPELGGGAYLDVGCYPVSLAAALFPDADPEVLLAEIVTRADGAVDTSGCAVLRYPNGVRGILDWATDVAYRNDVDIWGSAGCLRTDLIFSKSAHCSPTITVRDLHGAESIRAVPAANHFTAMFGAFCELASRADCAELERQRIWRRARLMDRIRAASYQRR